MVGADQHLGVALGLLADLRAAMAADIGKAAQYPVLPPDQDDALPRYLMQEIITRIRGLRNMPGQNPVAQEDALDVVGKGFRGVVERLVQGMGFWLLAQDLGYMLRGVGPGVDGHLRVSARGAGCINPDIWLALAVARSRRGAEHDLMRPCRLAPSPHS